MPAQGVVAPFHQPHLPEGLPEAGLRIGRDGRLVVVEQVQPPAPPARGPAAPAIGRCRCHTLGIPQRPQHGWIRIRPDVRPGIVNDQRRSRHHVGSDLPVPAQGRQHRPVHTELGGHHVFDRHLGRRQPVQHPARQSAHLAPDHGVVGAEAEQRPHLHMIRGVDEHGNAGPGRRGDDFTDGGFHGIVPADPDGLHTPGRQ